MPSDGPTPEDSAGLCARCSHVHIVENRRGSRFYRCRLADVDPAFLRYPPLPVLACRGYAPTGEVVRPSTE